MRRKKGVSFIAYILTIMLSFGVVFSNPSIVSADLEDDLKKVEDEIDNSKDNATEQKELAKKLLQEISELDQSIIETNTKINEKKQEKTVIEANLAAAEAELEKATADKVYYQKLLDERLAVMYMYGDEGYWEVLFGSTSFSDFIGRINAVTSIISYDQTIAEQLKQAELTIEIKKNEIADQNAQLEATINELNTQEANLESQKSQKNAKLAEAQKNETYWNAVTAEKEEEAAELRRVIAGKNTGGAYGNDFNNLIWPTPGYYTITDDFGYRIHPISGKWKMHTGTDIGAPYNARIVAPGNGKVIFAAYKYSFGNTVILDLGKDSEGNQYNMMFAHANSIAVREGDIVTQGQVLSYVGSTGDSTGPHLHFEVLINGVYKDPMDYVKR